MKKLFILALLTAFAAQGQIINDTTAQAVSYFYKGEKMTYALSYAKAMVKNADTAYSDKISYKADITVKDSTAAGYTIEWRFYDYDVAEDQEILKKYASKYEGMTIVYTTDLMGSFVELLNWRDVHNRNKEAMKTLENKGNVPAIASTLMDVLETRESVENRSIPEVFLFHLLHGTKFILNDPIVENTMEESPLVGPSIASELSIVLDEIDMENRTFTIRYNKFFPEINIDDTLFSGFMKLITDESVAHMSMTQYVGTVMYEYGWPVAVFCQKTVDFGDEQGFEIRTITLE